jgi:germination protein M
MAASKRNDKRSNSNAGTVFWLAAIVIVLFIFALNWGKIQATLARTNFNEIVKTQTDAKPGPKADAPADKPSPAPSSPAADQPKSATPKATEAPEPASPAKNAPKASQPEPQASPQATSPSASPQAAPSAAPKDAKPQAPKGGPVASTPKVQAPARSRSATLYFVRIDDDGVIVRQEVKRQIPASDSPLLDSLAALLKGPSEEEIRKKLMSLVPEGTKLLSAQVRGSTAVLNFNEAFMYNHYGIEGFAGQLKQIVYTATSFPTVQDVQILVEGEKRDYLGGEGVYIGKPLSRNSF